MDALDKRKDSIGIVLLNDVLDELSVKKIDVKENVIEKIKMRYLSLNESDKKVLNKNYQDFCNMYLN